MPFDTSRAWTGMRMSVLWINSYITNPLRYLKGQSSDAYPILLESALKVDNPSFWDDPTYIQLPSLTTAQQTSIASPESGMMIWNSDTATFNIYNGSNWVNVANATGGPYSVDANLLLADITTFGTSLTKVGNGGTVNGWQMATPRSLAILPGSTDAYVMGTGNGGGFFSLNLASGVCTRIGNDNTLGVDTDIRAIKFHDGVLYGVGREHGKAFTIDLSTGDATLLPNAMTETVPTSIISYDGEPYVIGDTLERPVLLNTSTGVTADVADRDATWDDSITFTGDFRWFVMNSQGKAFVFTSTGNLIYNVIEGTVGVDEEFVIEYLRTADSFANLLDVCLGPGGVVYGTYLSGDYKGLVRFRSSVVASTFSL